MKRLTWLLLTVILSAICFQSMAQAGLQGMNYQAVARNASGGVVASQSIKVRFTILAGTVAQYSELHTTTTTAQGLFTLVIGKGTPQSGTFAGITWNTANQTLRTEIDITGGTNYVIVGTTPFQSVPYALYSANPGPQGPQGIKGDQGNPGPQGLQGIPGNTGAQGLQGIQGPQGLKGDKGDKGDQGDAGPQGSQGLQGIPGTPGLQGVQGVQGIAGSPGAQINTIGFNPTGTLTINTTGVPATITSPTAVWLINGNAATSPASQFIGTTDATGLSIRTNSIPRITARPGGQVLINGTLLKSTQDALEVFGTGTADVTASFGYPINGYSSGGYAGIFGENTSTGQGVWGANTSTGYGVYGSNSANGTGVFGTSQTGTGVHGIANVSTAAGVQGINSNISGTGIIAMGNGLTTVSGIPVGAGLVANGRDYGLFAVGVNPTGIGIIANGSSTTGIINVGAGEGLSASGTSMGLTSYVVSTTVANNRWAGYFDYRGSGNGYAFIGGRANNIDYAILSAGTKSTIVKDEQGRGRVMYCPEAPEILFQDYGTGQLQNGFVHITLDPLLVRNIRVDDSHPLKVFIQLEGDCNGVFVTNKSPNGFDVRELQQGHSNVSFTWQIVATRADEKDASGNVTSEFSMQRFPIAPERMKGKEIKGVKSEPVETKPAIMERIGNAK